MELEALLAGVVPALSFLRQASFYTILDCLATDISMPYQPVHTPISDFLIRKESWMALFPMKNENSPCEAFRFCQHKVPNQFPSFVMKYAYGSGSLNFRLPDLVGKSIGASLGCFDFVVVPEGTISRLPPLPQVPIRFPKKWCIAYTWSGSLNLWCPNHHGAQIQNTAGYLCSQISDCLIPRVRQLNF